MLMRHCLTPLEKISPCDVGWGSITCGKEQEIKHCSNDPMEENCRNIIDIDNMKCPCCGQRIMGMKKD